MAFGEQFISGCAQIEEGGKKTGSTALGLQSAQEASCLLGRGGAEAAVGDR